MKPLLDELEKNGSSLNELSLSRSCFPSFSLAENGLSQASLDRIGQLLEEGKLSNLIALDLSCNSSLFLTSRQLFRRHAEVRSGWIRFGPLSLASPTCHLGHVSGGGRMQPAARGVEGEGVAGTAGAGDGRWVTMDLSSDRKQYHCEGRVSRVVGAEGNVVSRALAGFVMFEHTNEVRDREQFDG